MTNDPDRERMEVALRASLLRVARLIERLEAEGTLLDAPGDLQAIFGDLRGRLFEWELRGLPAQTEAAEAAEADPASADADSSESDAVPPDSLRIVREAEARMEALLRELEDRGPSDQEGSSSN